MRPTWWIAGTAVPAAAIAIELMYGVLSRAGFDPFPTSVHVILACAAPVANWIVWHLPEPRKAAAGFAAGVALPYACLALPVAPLALALVPFFGAGLLGLWPFGSLAASWRGGAGMGRGFLTALAGALALHLVAQAPLVLTAVGLDRAASGIPEESRSGVRLLRRFGVESRIAAACGGGPPLAFDVSHLRREPIARDTVQSIYFRVTGGVCATLEPDLAWISSRFDGTLDRAASVGSFAWTIELASTAPESREARASVDLSPGAVLVGAALWQGSTYSEARIGPLAGATPAALRVTTEGGGRVRVRCALPAGASRTRIRLDIAAPAMLRDGTLHYPMPRIVDRNFAVQPHFEHVLALDTETLRFAEPAAAPAYTVEETGAPFACAEDSVTAGAVCQIVADRHGGYPGAVALVVDGSAAMVPHVEAIVRALEAIPSGVDVFAVAGGDPRARIERDAARRIAMQKYAGGADAAPALAAAQLWAAREERSVIVWIHGPQPLDPAPVRWLSRREAFFAVAAEAGENRLVDAAIASGQVTRVPRSASLEGDLAHLFGHWGGGAELARIRVARIPPGAATAPAALVRIWAGTEVDRLRDLGMADQALALASAHGLVTPLTEASVGGTRTIPRTD